MRQTSGGQTSVTRNKGEEMANQKNKPTSDDLFTLFDVEGAIKFQDTQYYKDLIQNSAVVTCAHTAYFWAGEVIDVFGLPAIVGKMPQKIWVGLEPKPEPGIEYGVYKEYDPSNHMFRDVQVQETTRRQTIAFLNEWVGQLHARMKINSEVTKDGYRMHQFAETLYGRSHVAPKISGGRAVAEATAMAVAFLGLKEEELKHQQTVTTLKIPCQHETIDELLYLAWELAAIGYGGYHGASDIASAFMDSFPPLFVCRSEPVLEVPAGDDEPRPKKVRDLTFEARSMLALGLSSLPLWSVDVAVVFSGQNKRTLASLDVARVLRDMDNLAQQVANLPNISMNLDSKPSEALLKIGEMLTLACLDLILRVLSSHYAYELVSRLNKTINQYRRYMGMLGLTSPIMEKLMLFLEDEAGRVLAQVGRPGPGIKPTSEGIGGGILVVIPAPESRGALVQLIEDAKKLTPQGLGVRVDYASWEHGFPSAGVRILKSGTVRPVFPFQVNWIFEILSEMEKTAEPLPGENPLFTIGLRHEFKNASPNHVERLSSIKNRFDIYLNLLEGYVYVKGRRTKMHKAGSTFIALQILLEAGGKLSTEEFTAQLALVLKQDPQEFKAKFPQTMNWWNASLKNNWIKATTQTFPEENRFIERLGGEIQISTWAKSCFIGPIRKKPLRK
jgi:hypothetical protein